MNVPVFWLSYDKGLPSRGYWDHGLLEKLFAGDLWRVPGNYKFLHTDNGLPDYWNDFKDYSQHGAIVIFPARGQTDFADNLNRDIRKFKWVILVLTGDEEAVFPFEKIKHKNMKLWVMSPHMDRDYPEGTRFIGSGFPPVAPAEIGKHIGKAIDRPLDWFFSGQITHIRRQQCYKVLKRMSGGKVYGTPGFTQGLAPAEYYEYMVSAKVAPAPSGPETPDSFRLFEALEAGCIPIADTQTPKGDFKENYWQYFFGEDVPFPTLTSYDQLEGYITDVLVDYPKKANEVFGWWLLKKRQMANNLASDIYQLSGKSDYKEDVTVLIATSPIKTHPSTQIIEETIASVRKHLPDSEIIIMADGVRDEQQEYAQRYEEYIQRLLWLAHHKWKNVAIRRAKEHMHQALMTKAALSDMYGLESWILFLEHDTPLVTDYEDFDWKAMRKIITDGRADVIRFHHEAAIPKDHDHMMLDKKPQIIEGIPLVRTVQWSQRPHLASASFYQRILSTHFKTGWRTMIEDVMHGVVYNSYLQDKRTGWNNYKLWIYAPEGNIKRSYHLDGRQDDQKYEMYTPEEET